MAPNFKQHKTLSCYALLIQLYEIEFACIQKTSGKGRKAPQKGTFSVKSKPVTYF